MTRHSSSILGSFGVRRFLKEHWQKAPLFLPGAVSSLGSPISIRQLTELACQEAVESRIVQKAARTPWGLRHGPFARKDFTQRPKSDWTLLVQDVDKHDHNVAALWSLIDFLPAWCIDDIMISIAEPGGSVGPHTDLYDVFLLQVAGERRWEIASECAADELRDDTDLCVLKNFHAEQSFVARPGDVLYLPPGVAHWGVAVDTCMTYSFGFRAPSEAELLSNLADWLLNNAGEARLGAPVEPGVARTELSPGLLESVARMTTTRLDGNNLWDWFGSFLTSPKPGFELMVPTSPLTLTDMIAALEAGRALIQVGGARFLFHCIDRRSAGLFVNGETHIVRTRTSPGKLANVLCEGTSLDASALSPWWMGTDRMALAELLMRLFNSGALEFRT